MMDASVKSLFIRGVVAVSLPLLMAGCAHTADQKPMHAVGCSNNPYLMKYDCSVDKIQEAAENGDPDAQYGLGYMYYYGIDTVRDTETAKLWIKRASDQGQPLAKKALSVMIGAQSSAGDTNGLGTDKPTPNSYVVHQQQDDVSKLNAGEPDKPITNYLPAYHSEQSSDKKAVLNQLSSNQSMNHHLMDPRLARNAKPILAKRIAFENLNSASVSKQRLGISTVASNEKGSFTLQLMASDSLSDLKTFAASHHLKSHAHVYQTAMNGKPWYMLSYGRYNTQHQAITALAQLQPDLKAYHPWVKSFATIQAEVRLNKIVA